jgi:hypothetical protein
MIRAHNPPIQLLFPSVSVSEYQAMCVAIASKNGQQAQFKQGVCGTHGMEPYEVAFEEAAQVLCVSFESMCTIISQ